MTNSFLRGFIKRASEYGVNEHQAIKLANTIDPAQLANTGSPMQDKLDDFRTSVQIARNVEDTKNRVNELGNLRGEYLDPTQAGRDGALTELEGMGIGAGGGAALGGLIGGATGIGSMEKAKRRAATGAKWGAGIGAVGTGLLAAYGAGREGWNSGAGEMNDLHNAAGHKVLSDMVERLHNPDMKQSFIDAINGGKIQ